MAGQSKRGFAAMGSQKQREIARRGGQTAHKKGTAHEFTPEEARIAGRRGGKAVSGNRQYMAEIGRKGGQSSGRHAAKLRQTQQANGNGGNGGEQAVNRSAAQNATDLIRADHRKVEELFSQYETVAGQDAQKATLVKQMCQELESHAQLEEEIFYPAVQASLNAEDEHLITEAIKEHQAVKDLVAQLKGMAPDDASRDSTVQQLKERVTHYVEEEEKEMLPKVERFLSDQLESLGAQMQQRKQQLAESTQGSAPEKMPKQPMPEAD